MNTLFQLLLFAVLSSGFSWYMGYIAGQETEAEKHRK